MKYIPTEHLEERVALVGYDMPDATDMGIATVIANLLENLREFDAIAAALVAIDTVRHLDKPENAGNTDRLIAWYRERAGEGAGGHEQ